MLKFRLVFLTINMPLDWIRRFEIYDTASFVKEDFRRTVCDTLRGDPDPGTAQYVAVVAQRVLQELKESQILSAHEKNDAEIRSIKVYQTVLK